MADFALKFDGSQNYVDVGTMGNFGSNLGSGFYASFDITSTNTAVQCVLGTLNTGSSVAVMIEPNFNAPGVHRVFFRDSTGLVLSGTFNYDWNDGKKHTVTISITPSTNTIAVTVDGISQGVSYSNQQTPATFINFEFSMNIGRRHNRATPDEYLNATINNFKMGTSPANLFGDYAFDEGTGITAADTSGNNNTGTLSGNPVPTWVLINPGDIGSLLQMFQ